MKKYFVLFTVLLFIFSLASCNDKKLVISGVRNIEVGESITLTTNYEEEIEWFSSDEGIAGIKDGIVTGYKPGIVTIKAILKSSSKIYSEISIEVLKLSGTISIVGNQQMIVGDTQDLNVVITGLKDKTIEWSSSNPEIISCEAGSVTALQGGTATIFAKSIWDENILGTIEIKVYNKIIINGARDIEKGEPIQLTSNYDEELVWSTSNPDIAIIDDKGKLTGVSAGRVDIKVYLKNNPQVEVYLSLEVLSISGTISISGNKEMMVDDTQELSINITGLRDNGVIWSSSNSEIITCDNGIITALKEGTAVIYATSVLDENIFGSVEIHVYKKLTISGDRKVEIGKNINLTTNYQEEVIWSSSDEAIATVIEGKVLGKKVGNVNIKATLKTNPQIFAEISVEVLKIAGTIRISGDKEMKVGDVQELAIIIIGLYNDTVVWSSSNPNVLKCEDNKITALEEGIATIYVKSVLDTTISGSITITALKNPDQPTPGVDSVENILNNMTLEQKIGQMFIVGFSGTSMPSSLTTAIQTYHFGNVIYMGANVSNPSSITKLSNDIQNAMVKYNSVPAFISIDQEGGRVARIKEGGTHFISQMALAATNNPNNAYLEASAIAKELRSYGINVDFAPVLDVNNNPDNPIIGIRSYADDPALVAAFGKNAIRGFKSGNVMATAKHFPGHGNTATDSHYGLPIITSSIDELYKVELAPFIEAINGGIDAIMTTHIIFKAIDANYPATLSSKVLTNLLRNQLNYKGLIITDGMEMAAVASNFGNYSQTAVMAVKAGVDILTYTSLSNPMQAYNGLLTAVKNNEISEERINQSVRRILTKKLSYNIINNYLTTDTNRSTMLASHEDLNNRLARESLTLIKGTFNGLDKNKSTLIISPTTSNALGTSADSFAEYASVYLQAQGYNSCTYKEVSTNISSSDANTILQNSNSYEQIVVAMSNVKTNNYSRTSDFINELAKKHNNVVIIALDTPYDLLSYSSDVQTYICVYGYQKASVIALSKYLNGEFSAQGKSPIDESIFK